MYRHDRDLDLDAAAPPGEPLARRPPPLSAGSLVVRSLSGRLSVSPRDGREVYLGRDADTNHIALGDDDRAVSRRHLVIRGHDGGWELENRGRRPVRVPGGVLPPGGDPVPLPAGYTAVVLDGTSRRTHVVEIFVSDGNVQRRAGPADETLQPTVWPLTRRERDVVLVLGQRYLRLDPDPQPLTWLEAAEELQELDPGSAWTRRRVEWVVTQIRERLARRGVRGLRADELDGPVGNRLSHHLIRELVDSATIVATDLAELDARESG